MSRTALAVLILAAGCGRKPTETTGDPDPPAPARTYTPSEWVTAGDVRVRVTRAGVGKVPMLRGRPGGPRVPHRSAEELLWLRVEVENNSMLTVRILADGVINPAVADQFGNAYAHRELPWRDPETGERIEAEGHERGSDIAPGKRLTKVITFRPPMVEAETLTLRLPSLLIGQKGELVLKLPASMWK